MSQIALIKVVFSFLLAVIPACIWGYIFYSKQVGQKRMTVQTFAVGALFVLPILGYKSLWKYFPWLNAFQYTHPFKDDLIGFSNFTLIPVSVLLTFLIVGVIEEITKFFAVKVTDRGRICSIDDAIEMAISAALGFSFSENMIYFYNIITTRGPENILMPFIFRSLFSTFAHLMFSGVLGYYYGLAHFASPILQDEHFKNRWKIFRTLAQIFHFRKDVGFREEKMLQGLLFAVSLHALFNIFLEMDWTFLIVPYLTGGYILLSHLLSTKEDHKLYGRLTVISQETQD